MLYIELIRYVLIFKRITVIRKNAVFFIPMRFALIMIKGFVIQALCAKVNTSFESFALIIYSDTARMGQNVR